MQKTRSEEISEDTNKNVETTKKDVDVTPAYGSTTTSGSTATEKSEVTKSVEETTTKVTDAEVEYPAVGTEEHAIGTDDEESDVVLAPVEIIDYFERPGSVACYTTSPSFIKNVAIGSEGIFERKFSKEKLRLIEDEVESVPARDMDRIGDYKESIATTVSGAAPSSASTVNSALAGKLTAGEINDFQKWNMWEDIASGELDAYRNIWGMNPTGRYSVLVQTEQGKPIVDCDVELVSKGGEVIWKTKTDNTGKGELWSGFNMSVEERKVDFIRVNYDGKTLKIERPKSFDKGINTFKISTGCDIPEVTDILFTVDATGSMGDEISYLQAELVDVVNKVKDKHKDVQLRLGSVFYRDHGDTYLTVNSPFNQDIHVTNDFIAQQYADGGGDGPEAVDDAFAASIDDMNWSARARARLMFVILDAPPHGEKAFTDKMNLYVKKAAEKGVRIVPLVASGGGYDIDKSLEYLMRCCALGTNGTYAFLTDHSGVGGAHTAPSTDKYDVETLNALLLRIIDQFLFVPDCNVEQFVMNEDPEDTTSFTTQFPLLVPDSLNHDSIVNPNLPTQGIFTLKCYPNPATDYIWAQTSEQVKEIFLADNSGKIIERLVPTNTLFQIDLTNYPTGVYFLKAWINDKWASTRIVVARI